MCRMEWFVGVIKRSRIVEVSFVPSKGVLGIRKKSTIT